MPNSAALVASSQHRDLDGVQRALPSPPSSPTNGHLAEAVGCPFAAQFNKYTSTATHKFASVSQQQRQPQQGAHQCPAAGVHQHWMLKRPQLEHDPKLTRRQLRRLNKAWTLEELAQHKYADDAWIAVDGRVYDITEHLVNHPGWDTGCQVTTVLSILAHLGIDCTEEFRDIHRPYPVAWQQLKPFYIGDLA